ncbi:receptor-like protein EIX1 [Rhododendron vialii]|uniref:receptor-like protein EIX1 n=1 Tax=Rhododendron vialii TaxID=182163 RepID=UPI00265F0173|nr:receptor-like protein EIX1 [Rhododendron vialii]
MGLSMATSAAFAFFVCFLISIATFHVCFCIGISSSANHTHNNITCFENEREALVKFKQDLKDPSNRLSSWDIEEDCCQWAGVVCDNFTGHVREIRLQSPYYLDSSAITFAKYEAFMSHKLRGKVNPSLLDLKHLQYLDLSNNDFEGTSIPSFIGSIANLRYLNLSLARFCGAIPPQLGNLTKIHYMGLMSGFDDHKELVLHSDGNLHWLSGLVSLQHLDMSRIDLSKALDWLQVTSNLPSLVELHLSYCRLEYAFYPSSTNKINFTSLDILDLSYNNLGSSVPGWIFSLNHLVSLNLMECGFNGPIPSGLQNMTSLKVLDWSGNPSNSAIPSWLYSLRHLESLSLQGNLLHGVMSIAIGNLTSLVSLRIYSNSLSGPIPMSIGRLSFLIMLDLSYNKFNGTLPESLGHLGKLDCLLVNNNLLQGVVSDVHFVNLTRLRYLNAGGNSLTLKASENWVPPFQLKSLSLDSWQLGTQFPLWLPSQRKLQYLSIANTRISESIPTWFWPSFPNLEYVNLSRNQIRGEISSLRNVGRLYVIDLSSNYFSGTVPLVPSNLNWLDLSKNFFSRSIYHVLCGKGEEPNNDMFFLNLGDNLLSGKIPDCWKHPYLQMIKLENNNLRGSIPNSIGQLSHLQSLHLRHNNLSGELPRTLQNCSFLRVIDLSENRFTGSIPPWIGNSFLTLIDLNLRSNKFSGDLPHELCRLSSLQILDVAHNNLSGSMPRCFANFSAMAEINNSRSPIFYHIGYGIADNLFLVTKGRYVEYSTTLGLVTNMDLSRNNLSGEILEELTELRGLWSLNLSGNHLTGRIPRNIGDMRQLESLDFSLNQLSGEIPSSISSLTFLSHLNLSYNNLTGKIPSSTQLQSMNDSSFLGNMLCGPPLTSCNPKKPVLAQVDPPGSEENGEGSSEALFFASMALGFAVGFWIVLGPLLFKRSWRIAYFRVLEDIWHKLWDLIS